MQVRLMLSFQESGRERESEWDAKNVADYIEVNPSTSR